MQTKHITINIGPQDPVSWMFIAIASVFIAMFVAVANVTSHRDVEIARIKANAATQESK